MRITNGIMHNRLVNNIQNGLQHLDTYYDQLSTGKKINYPSDDPVGLVIGMNLKNGIREGEQYKKNANTAIDWLNSADAALDQLTKVLHRLETLGVSGANGPLAEASMVALADEVNELKEHLLQIANTQHEKMYIFGGQQTDDPPFLFDDTFPIGDPGRYQYVGDNNPMVMEIGTGINMEISVPGNSIFGDLGSGDFFTQLDEFEQHLRACDHQTVSDTDLKIIAERLDQVLSVRSQIGAKVNRLERSVERYEMMDTNFKSLLSKTEDADYAEVTMNMKMMESVYQAALATGARIMQNTLVNYM